VSRAQCAGWVLAALVAGAGCTAAPQPEELKTKDLEPVASQAEEIQGENLAGTNLSGTNLSGSNLAGANLGGNNLAGNNLAGTNLSGTNLAGNNLAGSNLAGSNLSGSNLSGNNLSGNNLAGTNLAGNNLSGTNLSGTNLSGTNSGVNIHNLSIPPSANVMLWSAEACWKADGTNRAQCVVMGIGSTACPKLLGQQSANAKINVALGKLSWGFASTSG